jgi:hypothetical protein
LTSPLDPEQDAFFVDVHTGRLPAYQGKSVLNEFTAEYLISIAETASIPPISYELWPWRIFDAKEGWKVMVYYDVDELDYIDHFVTPDGQQIDIWEWPESDEKALITGWPQE